MTSGSDSIAARLVDEGLQLYSRGRLDEALACWRQALRLDEQIDRANEYIKYVETHRDALEASFKEKAPAEAESGNDNLPVVHPPPQAASRTSDRLAPVEEDRSLEVDLSDLGQDEEDLTAQVLVDQPVPGGFRVVEGGGQSENDDFKPNENTPIGVKLPEPSRLVPAIDAGSDSELSAGQRTPSRLAQEPLELDLGDDRPLVSREPQVTSQSLAGAPSPADAFGRPGEAGLEVVVDASPGLAGSDGGGVVLGETNAPAPDEEDPLLSGAQQLYEQGTYESSMQLCEQLVAADANNEFASRLLELNRQALLAQYEQLVDDLAQVPLVQVPQHEIVWHKLDHRAGFLLSRIDGMLSYADIVDISGMTRFETMRILAQLVEQGVISPRR